MDTESLLKLLKENSVDFVIIGATAFPVHGYARATLDIDVFIRPERNNAESTLIALKKFGYDVTDISINDLISKKLLIRQYIVETDIHPFVKGTTFDKVWANKIDDYYGNTPVYYAGLDDLIEMKQAAGRAKDLDDLKFLLQLKERQKS